MKTSVKKMIMSFTLIGCLTIGASDASAQSRSRSQGGSTTSRSQSAAVSSSSKSTAPSVSRVGSASSGSRSTSTSQVSRPSSTSVSRSTSTPQVSRSTSSTPTSVGRSTSSTPQVSRTDHSRPSTVGTSGSSKPNTGSITGRSATTSPSTGSSIGSGSITTTPQVSRTDQSRPSTVGTSGSSKPNTGSVTGRGATTRPGSGSGSNGSTIGISKSATDNVKRQSDLTDKRVTTDVSRENGTTLSTKPNFGKKPGDGGGKPSNGGGKPDQGGKPSNGGGKPDQGGGKPHDHGGNHGYNPKHPYDYDRHHYRDEFRMNHMHHDWTRPLPPPARPYRPAPWVWVRPTIPVGWHPYVGTPVIDRILGLAFGSLYDVSLDYLYYSGYYIDGYADGIIYLRDVPMLNLYWPDVMLNYEYNKLVNAQFVYHNSYYSTSRFDKVYRSLSRVYGAPVYRDGMTASWFGGNSTGYVTLSLVNSCGDYYTTLSIGY